MAEIMGIPNTDPSQIGLENLKKGKGDGLTTEASKALLGLFKNSNIANSTLKNIQNDTNKIVDILLAKGDDKVKVYAPKIGADTEEISTIRDNTQALNALTQTIKESTEMTLKVDGSSGNFFMKFLSFSQSKKRTQALDKFGDVFGNVIEKIAKASKHTESIEKLGKGLMSLFAPLKEIGKSLALASVGIALFGFTILTFLEAVTVGDLVAFTGVILAIWGASKLLKGVKLDFAMTSASIAILGLAIWGFNELITPLEGLKFGITLSIVGAGILAFTKITQYIAKNEKNIILAGASIALIGGAVWLFNKAISNLDDFDMVVFGKSMIALGVASGVFYLVGKGATEIAKGALATATVGGALWVLGWGLNKFLDIPRENLDNALEIGVVSGIAIGILALIGGVLAVPVMAGALATATVGGALWALSKGLQALTTVKVTEEQAITFSNSILYAVKALSVLGNPITAVKLMASVPTALALSASIISLSVGIKSISNLPLVPKQKYENFSFGIKSIVDSFASLGTIKSAKALANVAIITPLVGFATISAGMLKLLSMLTIDKDNVKNTVGLIGGVVNSFAKVFDDNKLKLSSVNSGVLAFRNVGNMIKSLADSVYEMARLEFAERKVVNGKVVLVGVKKLTTNDFKQVGVSIGSLLSAITEPLANIGGQKDTFSVGGFSITNPFSNKVKKGIDSMVNIGNVFKPLGDVVTTFNKQKISSNYIKSFNGNLSLLLGGISDAFINNSDKIKSAKKVDVYTISQAINLLTTSVSNKSFNDNIKNFTTFKNDLISVKDSMNAMDLEKITKFGVMINNLNEMAKVGAIKELVEVFTDFIAKFMEYTDSRTQEESSYGNNIYNNTNNQTTNSTNLIPTPNLINTNPSNNNNKNVQQNEPKNIVTIEEFNKLVTAVDKLSKMFISGDAKVQVKNNVY